MLLAVSSSSRRGLVVVHRTRALRAKLVNAVKKSKSNESNRLKNSIKGGDFDDATINNSGGGNLGMAKSVGEINLGVPHCLGV